MGLFWTGDHACMILTRGFKGWLRSGRIYQLQIMYRICGGGFGGSTLGPLAAAVVDHAYRAVSTQLKLFWCDLCHICPSRT